MIRSKWKGIVTAIIIGIVIGVAGKAMGVFGQHFSQKESDNVMVINKLPFGVEKNNPVPEVKQWNKGKQTLYYFNWGLKPTGGYYLEFMSLQNSEIRIKAISPKPNQMLIQVLTFPSLFLSLPLGNYHYRVFDEHGNIMTGLFEPKNPPLKMTIYLPRDGEVAPREILRDPNRMNMEKNHILIALEALFDQPEMESYLNRKILPLGVYFSNQEKIQYILLSKGYDDLDLEARVLLKNLIVKTITSITDKEFTSLELTTDTVLHSNNY